MKDPHGPALNERVWKIFEAAGFDTKPNANDPTEDIALLSPTKPRKLDLSAKDSTLKVKIIAENKTEPKIKGSFTARVNDFKELVKAAKAKKGLMVFSRADISEVNRTFAADNGILVWTEIELEYYQALVDTIGKEAKYEIIHSFGIRTLEQKTTDAVLALRFRQPFSDSDVADLFMFTMTPSTLLKTCVIYRKAANENAEAYQRILKKKRIQAVKNFVSTAGALLPPSIIVSLSDKVDWSGIAIPSKDDAGKPFVLSREESCDLGVLKIPNEYASMELIDGQHRLYGFVNADDEIRKNFNLTVLGLSGLSLNKKKDTFIAINDNAHRIDPSLVLYLKYTDDEKACQADPELMAIKLVVELNKLDPFKNRIRLLDFDPVGDRIITLKGFAGYDLKGLVGEKGLLRMYYGNDSAEYVSALKLYFSLVKSLFKAEWREPERFIIFTNRGISGFLKLLKSILKAEKARLDKPAIEEYLKALQANWTGSWEIDHLKNAYIGSKGWKDFQRDLVAAIRKKFPKFKP